ncbi:MAG: sigma-70 family RNA polymerase sigma factor [Bacteroidetes bacterium]|nr:sigma-70 family RNA polymerase sigma factor [Bacteroidota bacterium]MCB0851665.1 sigma-70 family RNA polymerase sigma factor [Bacteroidota bacterium]
MLVYFPISILAFWLEKEPQPYRGLDDLVLVEKYRETQDQTIILVLMERYAPQITAIAVSFLKSDEEVSEYAHQLFIVLREKLNKAHISTSFRGWLCMLVRNRFIDRARRISRKQVIMASVGQEEEVVNTSIENLDYQEIADKALSMLNERQRECVELFYWKHLTYKEIGQELGMSFNQVRGVIGRAHAKLKTHFGDEFSRYFED